MKDPNISPIFAHLIGIMDGNIDHGIYKDEPIIKPHGRLSWLLLMVQL